MSLEDLFEKADVISIYTRQQAIADGMLVDVTETAKEAGFKLHTVVTRNVWERCVRVPEGLEGQGQSESGRLWDVLWMALLAARRAPNESLVTYRVSVLTSVSPNGAPRRQEHELWLHVGPATGGSRCSPSCSPRTTSDERQHRGTEKQRWMCN